MTKVSVIIPSYNGAKKLPQILEKLRLQTIQDFELLIVLDGSTDNSEQVLENYNNYFSNFKVYTKKNGGRANVRNFGANKSEGDLLIFYDDDLLPIKDSVELHINHHKNYHNTIYQGDCSINLQFCETDFQKYNSYLSEKWASNLPLYPQPIPNSITFLSAANFSIPKNIFYKIGGFNETLTDCEDFDFCKKAQTNLITIFYDKNNKAWHNDLLTIKGFISRQIEYKKSYNKLLNENPERYYSEKNNIYKVNFFKQVVYKFLSIGIWITIIDKFNFIKFLPKFIKYYIYGLVITANLNKK